MCILFVAYQVHEKYPLIIAANRDEFFERPTLPLHEWNNDTGIIAGKDQQAGGTWLAINKCGDIGAITNYRTKQAPPPNAISRGHLVSRYLAKELEHETFTDDIIKNSERYAGYNLLFGNINSLHVFSNQDQSATTLTPGYYGLSNAFLDTPWPKLIKGRTTFETFITTHKDITPAPLFALLGNTQKANRDELPDTGFDIDFEHVLSSIFIKNEVYGTRSSSVILVDNDGNVDFSERTFDKTGMRQQQSRHRFTLKTGAS